MKSEKFANRTTKSEKQQQRQHKYNEIMKHTKNNNTRAQTFEWLKPTRIPFHPIRRKCVGLFAR